MPRHDEDDDWDDEGFVEDDEDATVTVPCPYCRRDVPEDTPRCPYCETYISEEDAPARRRPWWFLLGLALGLYVVYRWIAG